MTREDLLLELAMLSHVARMQRLVDVGREALSNAAVAAVLQELACGEMHERGFVLQACHGSRDGELILGMLGDSSRLIRSLSVKLVAVVCDDAQVRRVFGMVSDVKSLERLLKLLSKRRRCGLVDEALAMMSPSDSKAAARVLSYASREFVEQALTNAAQQGLMTTNWQRLAKVHPDAVLNVLTPYAEQVTQRDGWLIGVTQAVLPQLAERRPDRAIDWIKLLRRHLNLSDLPSLQRLMERRPTAMASMLLDVSDSVDGGFSKVAHRLETATLLALLENRSHLLPLERKWFHRLSPTLRRTLLQQFGTGWRDSLGCLPDWVVWLLPREERQREARAHWSHPPLTTSYSRRFAYASALPFEEARALLDPFIRSPDAELRALANGALVETVRFDRAQADELLRFVLARKNEQDPVRGALLGAMSRLPPSLWQASQLESLGLVIRQALDAADLSHQTAVSVQRVVVAVLSRHSDWAIEWLTTIVKERGQFEFGDLEQRLTDDDVRQLAPQLLPVLKSWNKRERHHALIAATNAFGRRLRVFPGLIELMENVAVHAGVWFNVSAVTALQTHVPKQFAALVPKLLERDRSWITQACVYEHLHRHRQDLLDPYLGHEAFAGKFGTGRTRFVLPVDRGFQRWWPTQRATFAKTLHEVTQDAERDSPALLRVIAQLAALLDQPDATRRLISLADVRNPKLVTRDAALRALGRLDAGQGLSSLLDALNDDRGRIAIYALRRAFLEQPPHAALQQLRIVPREKVTVAKEVARLIGDLPINAARSELLEWVQQPLHRDVRVAVLRALWGHLQDAAVWDVLDQAALDTDPSIAASVSQIPSEGLSTEQQRRLAHLLATLLKHPDAGARRKTLERCNALLISDVDRVLSAPLMTALKSSIPDEVELAAHALFATYAGQDAIAVAPVVRELLPNRRSLNALLLAFESRIGRDARSAEQLMPTFEVISQVLSKDPLCVTWRLRLAAVSLSGDELAERLIASNESLHSDALAAVLMTFEGDASDSTIANLLGSRRLVDRTALQQLERRLAGHPDERLRRIALAALIAQSQAFAGWTQELRERLKAYAEDSSPLVASAAAFTFPPLLVDEACLQSQKE